LNEEATKKHQPLTEHPSITRGLSFTFSNLTQSGIRRICKPLGKKSSSNTAAESLWLE